MAESDAPALFPELVSQPVASYTTGLLPSQRLEELIQSGRIHASTPISPDQVQPTSIDLRLSSTAYRVHASFLPNPNTTVQKKLQELKSEEVDLSQPTYCTANAYTLSAFRKS